MYKILDIFTIRDIVSYCDIDTKFVMKSVCKQCCEQFSNIGTVFDKYISSINLLVHVEEKLMH